MFPCVSLVGWALPTILTRTRGVGDMCGIYMPDGYLLAGNACPTWPQGGVSEEKEAFLRHVFCQS